MSESKRKNTPGGRANPDYFPCPICEGDEFQWGTTTGHTSTGFRFIPDQHEKFSKGSWVRTRECMRCGNLQFFTKEH